MSVSASTDIDRVLAAWSVGEPASAPAEDVGDAAVLVARARFHGVLPLIHAHAVALAGVVPPGLLAAAAADARACAALELAQRPVIAEVLALLHAAGADPLLIKGAALAHSHYPEPWQRPRADIDLLVAPERRARAEATLAAAGFSRGLQLPGDRVSYQASWSRRGAGGVTTSIDLHWRINNAETLSRLLDHAELAASAVPLPVLGPHARAPAAPQALLIACLHYAGSRDAPYHRGDIVETGGDRLIWLYDLLLLEARLDPHGCADWRGLVLGKRAAALVDATVGALRHRFPPPHNAVARLTFGGDARDARLARYLGASPARRRWLDFLALDGPGDRWRFLRQQLWPPADYLRQRYPDRAGASPLRLRLSRIAAALGRIR
jgi:hypothetical protein